MKKHDKDFQTQFAAALPPGAEVRYEIIDCLHQNYVYRVRLPGKNADAVIKTGAADEIEREYEMLKQLQSLPEKIAPVPYAYWVAPDGTGNLMREYIPGQTLADWRSEQGELPPAQIRNAGQAICRIAGILHTAGYIVRDIKPANFIRTPQGEVHLIDFDTLRMYNPGKDEDTQCMGTRGYAAPEQYGFGQTSPQTDIYGLGVTLLVL